MAGRTLEERLDESRREWAARHSPPPLPVRRCSRPSCRREYVAEPGRTRCDDHLPTGGGGDAAESD